MVYFVIKNRFEFGLCYAFLYVSKQADEWIYDNEDLCDGCPYAYVKNIDDECCSEYGRIGIREFFGSLVRIA